MKDRDLKKREHIKRLSPGITVVVLAMLGLGGCVNRNEKAPLIVTETASVTPTVTLTATELPPLKIIQTATPDFEKTMSVLEAQQSGLIVDVRSLDGRLADQQIGMNELMARMGILETRVGSNEATIQALQTCVVCATDNCTPVPEITKYYLQPTGTFMPEQPQPPTKPPRRQATATFVPPQPPVPTPQPPVPTHQPPEATATFVPPQPPVPTIPPAEIIG